LAKYVKADVFSICYQQVAATSGDFAGERPNSSEFRSPRVAKTAELSRMPLKGGDSRTVNMPLALPSG
jgi:hypothetical protein